jgi:hypothetical protein
VNGKKEEMCGRRVRLRMRLRLKGGCNKKKEKWRSHGKI